MAITTYRNAFLTRFSDRTGLKNTSFLSMYAPQIFRKLLTNENLLLPKTSWLVGIPGSGKSTILRLLEIDMIADIIHHKDIYRQLYDVLEEASFINDDVISKIGLYVHIDDFYYEASKVNIPNVKNERLFYTLINLRIARQLLKAISVLKINNRTNKDEIIIKGVLSEKLPPSTFGRDTNIVEFEKYIIKQEKLISQVLMSFPGSKLPENLELHYRFSSLDLIDAQQKYHQVDFILMIDDAHDLQNNQFALLKNGIERRNTFPRWIATRKHIYSINKLLGCSNGTLDGRETENIDLDKELSTQPAIYKKFIKILVNKRLNFTSFLNEFTIENIESLLSNNAELDELDEERIAAIKKGQSEKKQQFMEKLIHKYPEIDELFNDGSMSLLGREMMLIKLHRIVKKKQPSLFPENLGFEDEMQNIASKDKQAAKLFLKKRAGLPLFSGFKDILSASNNNVEQFLRVFTPFVDRLIYKVELDKNRNIDAKEQNKIFLKIANDYIDKIISKLVHGKKICQLIDNLGRFFSYRTYEPNAPHAPGVTQFALLTPDLDLLFLPKTEKEPWISELSNILSTSIAFNVIIPENAQRQGSRHSEFKHIFSINRLLCVKYSLPLQKGDFQKIPLNLLAEMCYKKFSPETIIRRKKSPPISGQLKIWTGA